MISHAVFPFRAAYVGKPGSSMGAHKSGEPTDGGKPRPAPLLETMQNTSRRKKIR
jgi:hypothetical protein